MLKQYLQQNNEHSTLCSYKLTRISTEMAMYSCIVQYFSVTVTLITVAITFDENEVDRHKSCTLFLNVQSLLSLMPFAYCQM